MAHNSGVILHKPIGVGKPREWASMRGHLATCAALWSTILVAQVESWRRMVELADRFEDQLLGSWEHFSTSSGTADSMNW